VKYLYTPYYDARGWFSARLSAPGWFDRGLSVDAASVAAIVLTGTGIPSAEAFGSGTLTVQAALRGRALAGGGPRRGRVKPRRVLQPATLRASGIPSAEAFGVGKVELRASQRAEGEVVWLRRRELAAAEEELAIVLLLAA
jgi:hypothetical protein